MFFQDKFEEIINVFTKIWKIVIGCILIPYSLKSLIISSAPIIYLIFHSTSNECKQGIAGEELSEFLTLSISSICLFVSSFIVLSATIGLLLKRKWSKTLFYLIFPIQFVISVVFMSILEDNIIESLRYNLLVPPCYIFIIWFLNRPSIKKEFEQ